MCKAAKLSWMIEKRYVFTMERKKLLFLEICNIKNFLKQVSLASIIAIAKNK